MNFIEPFSRSQMTFVSLEDRVALDNPVRLIDAFVERLDFETPGLWGTDGW